MKVTLVNASGSRAQHAKRMCEFLIKHLDLAESKHDLVILPLSKKFKIAGETVMFDGFGGIMMRIHFGKSFGEFAHAVAHEMVHVWQMANDRLKFTGKSVIWDGKRYSRDKLPEYLCRPWEVEALLLQGYLVRLVDDHLFTSIRNQVKIGTGKRNQPKRKR